MDLFKSGGLKLPVLQNLCMVAPASRRRANKKCGRDARTTNFFYNLSLGPLVHEPWTEKFS
jgi:hypothetical protein